MTTSLTQYILHSWVFHGNKNHCSGQKHSQNSMRLTQWETSLILLYCQKGLYKITMLYNCVQPAWCRRLQNAQLYKSIIYTSTTLFRGSNMLNSKHLPFAFAIPIHMFTNSS